MRVAAVFAHHIPDASHDRPAIGLRKEVNFHFDTLTDVVRLFGGQEHAGDTEVDDLTGMPRSFGNRAHPRGPFHAVPAGSALLYVYHRQSTQQDPRAASSACDTAKS